MENELNNAISESLPDDNVQQESLPVDDATTESSTEVQEETQEQEQQPFNEHPRFQELVDQKNEAKERADRYEQHILLMQEKQSQPQAQPEKDPYEGLTPEERYARDWVADVARREAKKIAQPEIEQARQERAHLKAQNAAMIYERFQQHHPDIKTGSPEENQIAQKYKQTGNLDDAYKIVMYEKSVQTAGLNATAKSKQHNQQQIKAKQAANLEQGNIPPNAPINNTSDMTSIDIVDQYMKGTGRI